jgi:hypothetical protein
MQNVQMEETWDEVWGVPLELSLFDSHRIWIQTKRSTASLPPGPQTWEVLSRGCTYPTALLAQGNSCLF